MPGFEYPPPIPDPHKPKFPYTVGLKLSVRHHNPPTPFGTGYKSKPPRQRVPPEQLTKFTQSEYCLWNPPISTASEKPLTVLEQTPTTLEIVKEIACADERGAQVALCRIDDNQKRLWVAKIYDPLYYAFADKEFYSPVDIAWYADQDYSREATAYAKLKEAGIDGLFAPRFFGSWSFDMTLRGKRREVRMVLMEFIRGVSLDVLLESGQAGQIPESTRMDILAKAMEIESKISFYGGVRHHDFAPRNIMVDLNDKDLQVMLVDFNYSVVYDIPGAVYKQFPNITLPMSPTDRFWGTYPEGFGPWVAQKYRSDPRRFRTWLEEQWQDSSEFAPPLGRPK